MRKKTVWFSRFPMTDVNLQLTFIRKFCAFVKTNSIQFYLFLQVELERVFFVLLALLYEQEYMDTAEKKKWTFKVITWVQYHKIFLSRNTELHVDREGVTCQKTPQFGRKEYYCACVPNQMKIINLWRKVSGDSPTLGELPEVLQSLVSTSFLRCLPQPSLPRFLVQGGLRSEEQENIEIYTVKEIFYCIKILVNWW